jgi:hypothetical protein
MTQAQIMSLCQMEWTGLANLDYFTDILKERKYIYEKKELFNFFLNPDNNTIVRFNLKKLEFLAYLIHRLHKEKFIRLKVNKGYFLCIESHFTDRDGNKMRENVLKFLSCQVNTKKSLYTAIRAEVDEIIAYISKP